ncbi:tRNA (adenosine(37)-N6)-threonylcarbamoyltransferase complex ATPase subunit type 1 TsaE [Enterovirga sp. CN4-39]|uniref:tRNA (adenosine(37)-N6)-threonylcarbamoyltransferase complex ATPase subunit type 1 TsaE n=1 Tax=Enterovirga sp. CN4-39 TaxID=3400910 RepID=UPI003C080406
MSSPEPGVAQIGPGLQDAAMPLTQKAAPSAAEIIRSRMPITVALPDEAATEELGRALAAELQAGDLVALSGEIGAGKTTLARAILRARLGDPELEAPSPTFTLLQTYESGDVPLVHADLYRIGGGGELYELGFDEMQASSIVLVEWPERAVGHLPAERLDILLELDAESGTRRALISGAGPLAERVLRAYTIAELLDGSGWGDAERVLMQGDASTRAYERLMKPSGETAILMISPPRPDGPPVRRGKPYSAIARLAESVHAFSAMDRGLIDQGLSAPSIYAEDLDVGLLVLEDFGSEPVVDQNGPIPDRYAEATRLLARLHARSLPTALPYGEEGTHQLPPYDLDAFMIEAELLLDWYLPHIVGTKPSGSVRAEFGHIWRDALAGLLAGRQTWTLRDFHSPNLIWLPEREGIRRVGLLDFQDAVLGPPAYDVASLLQDARVTVPPDLELKLLALYGRERKAADASFDMAEFATAYSIMGAQRATKILGIFARLDRRDGKPQYLAHLPRIRAYLARNLAHPALARLQGWFEYHGGDVFPKEEPADEEAAPESAPAGIETDTVADRLLSDAAEAGAATNVSTEPVAGGGAGAGKPAAEPEPRMVAMVLAAGLGKRMRPITDTRPKPLVEVAGRPLIDHALGRLLEAGLSKVVVNVHYLPDMIEDHVASLADLSITISDERDALLETGGGVKRALPLLGPEFLVLNSDSLWTERETKNLSRLLETWRPEEMDILLLLAPRKSLGYDGLGDFNMDANGRLTRRVFGALAPHVYAGAAIMKAELFDNTPEGAFSLNLLFDRAIEAGRLFGVALDGEWLHVGTPEAIGQAEARLAQSGA